MGVFSKWYVKMDIKIKEHEPTKNVNESQDAMQHTAVKPMRYKPYKVQ